MVLDLNPATADVVEALSEIPTPELEIQHQRNECLLKLMLPPKLIDFFNVTDVRRCYHISLLTSEQVWVSDDRSNFILTNTTGVTLHHFDDICRGLYGAHTVTNEGELIYIDKIYNINKLSKDIKTTTKFIEREDVTWIPRCLYWSLLTGDLLVAMRRKKIKTGKVNRYNQS